MAIKSDVDVGRVDRLFDCESPKPLRPNIKAGAPFARACQYTIISEASDTRGNATTWAKGEDGYWYRCIQAVDGRRVWTQFPPDSEAAASMILPKGAPGRRHKRMKFFRGAY